MPETFQTRAKDPKEVGKHQLPRQEALVEPSREDFCLEHQVDSEELLQQVLDLVPNKSPLMETLEEKQHYKLNLKAKDLEDLSTKAKTIIQENLVARKMQVEGS